MSIKGVQRRELLILDNKQYNFRHEDLLLQALNIHFNLEQPATVCALSFKENAERQQILHGYYRQTGLYTY